MTDENPNFDSYDLLVPKYKHAGSCEVDIERVSDLNWLCEHKDGQLINDTFITFHAHNPEFRLSIIRGQIVVFKITICPDQAITIINRMGLVARSAPIGVGCTYRISDSWGILDELERC